jgi:hypothetical protein
MTAFGESRHSSRHQLSLPIIIWAFGGQEGRLALLLTRRSQHLSLFNELKRRKVLRVGIGYIIAAWLVAQVADNFLAPV